MIIFLVIKREVFRIETKACFIDSKPFYYPTKEVFVNFMK